MPVLPVLWLRDLSAQEQPGRPVWVEAQSLVLQVPQAALDSSPVYRQVSLTP